MYVGHHKTVFWRFKIFSFFPVYACVVIHSSDRVQAHYTVLNSQRASNTTFHMVLISTYIRKHMVNAGHTMCMIGIVQSASYSAHPTSRSSKWRVKCFNLTRGAPCVYIGIPFIFTFVKLIFYIPNGC